MITIFHGENISASRKAFIDFRQEKNPHVTFSGLQINISNLTQALEANGLFETNNAIFIEERISKKKQSKELEALVSYLISHIKSEVVLWESKELTKKQLTLFKNPVVKQFSLTKSMFSFLDSLYPGKGKLMVKFFHDSLITEEAEFLFFMLVRQFRILLALSEYNSSHSTEETEERAEQIDEVKRLAPWQKGKLQKQSGSFGKEKLMEIYTKLFNIESGLKTGTLSMPLVSEIDFLLLEI